MKPPRPPAAPPTRNERGAQPSLCRQENAFLLPENEVQGWLYNEFTQLVVLSIAPKLPLLACVRHPCSNGPYRTLRGVPPDLRSKGQVARARGAALVRVHRTLRSADLEISVVPALWDAAGPRHGALGYASRAVSTVSGIVPAMKT